MIQTCAKNGDEHRLIDSMKEEINRLEDHIIRHTKYHSLRTYCQMQTVLCIDCMLALVILYEIDVLEHFTSVQQFSSHDDW